MSLGENLRKLRVSHHLTLDDVAKRASLSKAYISQMEKDKANPSLGTLKAVMDVYGMPIASLFDGSPADTIVVRKSERKTYNLPQCNVHFELLSPDTHRKIEFLLTIAEPGVSTGPQRFVHEGEECGIILRGKLKLYVGDREFILEEGDSVYYNSSVPHGWENVGDIPVQSIWAITPPSF